jgi:hypothetical protein
MGQQPTAAGTAQAGQPGAVPLEGPNGGGAEVMVLVFSPNPQPPSANCMARGLALLFVPWFPQQWQK